MSQQAHASVRSGEPTGPGSSRGSECVTAGIRVAVEPRFVPDQSDPSARRWLFTYRVRVANEGVEAAQLMERRWEIVDSTGEREEVDGPGVVGQQPRLEPGQSFEYSSFCQLRTAWGTMEGLYRFRTDDGRKFETKIARFYLVGPGMKGK